MDNLNLELYRQEICINGDKDKTISFCPDDINIINRYQESMEELEEIKQDVFNLNQDIDENNINETIKKIFNLDKIIKEKIDYIFNSEISEKVFGETSCLAVGRNGQPIFQNLLETLLNYCTNRYSDKIEEVKNSDKANKYLSKYKNKYVKKRDFKKSNKYNNR